MRLRLAASGLTWQEVTWQGNPEWGEGNRLGIRHCSLLLSAPGILYQMNPVVGVIMGSKSDLETMQPAADILKEFGVSCEIRIVSAHRTPKAMVEYAESARERGLKVIIAGAGGAA